MTLPTSILRKCWFLAGPTAVGKTNVSFQLADVLGAEIISMDSMAIYRTMDVGTAKPSVEERNRVPHHLVDVVEPHEEFSVADYLTLCEVAVAEILDRGRVPLFVGGTGLYLRSLLRGVFSGPEADWTLRAELEEQSRVNGNAWLHRQLQDIDPSSAEKLHANDVRRVIRAIEVHRKTGRPLSELHDESARSEDERPQCAVWLEPPRDWLYERIDRRVDQMMAEGLLDEVRRLLSSRPTASKTARQALGYRELIDHLEGRCCLEVAIDQIKTGTRQFAKRQHTWFRGLVECQSIPVSGCESAEQIVSAIRATATL